MEKKLSQVMESYKHDLTPEEVENALSLAKKSKEYLKNRIAYKQKISQERVFVCPKKDELRDLFLLKYSENEGKDFIETEFNKEILDTLLLYFSGDVAFEQKGEGYRLWKGILLQGPIGSCKTSIMKAFQNIGCKSFGIIPCKEIERKFDKEGSIIIDKYSQTNLDWNKRIHGWLFDDLGWESMGKHYGKESNIMEDLLEAVNTRKSWEGMHLTSNLSIPEMNEKYGDRLMSRMKMMFNQISYHPESTDMRS